MFSWLFTRKGLSYTLISIGIALVVISYGQVAAANLWYWFFSHSGVVYTVDPTIEQKSESDRVRLITPVSTDFGIVIEKLGINEKVAANVNPFDANTYLPVLQKYGVAQAEGAAYPGQAGTVYLFGHSTVNIWDIAKYHAPFTLLNKLAKGDRIVMYYQNQQFIYTVKELKVISPIDVHYISDVQPQPTLILQTCDPPGSDTKRLLVIATLQN